MNIEKILSEAPEGATHYDNGIYVQSTGKQPLEKYGEDDWDYEQGYEMEDIHSLADLREIQQLRAENEALKASIPRGKADAVREYAAKMPNSQRPVTINSVRASMVKYAEKIESQAAKGE